MKRVALITGGSTGIGKAIAIKLAQNEYDILITYNSSEDEAINCIKEISSHGVSAKAFKADFKLPNVTLELYQEIKEAGFQVTDLINNAGLSVEKDFIKMELSDILDVININLTSVMLLTQYFLQDMISSNFGNILNISSQAGIFGGNRISTYASSKAGINIFTKALAREVGKHKIRVNAISPGIVDTKMNAEKLKNPDITKNIISGIPLGRIGTPEDIANLTNFLLSSEAFYINGEIIGVSGGR